MGNLRVIVADDHPFVLLGIRASLAAQEGIEIVGEADSATTLIALLKTTPCDVLVTDLTMPEAGALAEDGLRLVRRVCRDWPQVRIVVLTALTNAAILRAIMSHGVTGMLNKTESMEDLVAAIRCAGYGRPYVGQPILDALATASGDPVGLAPIRRLSPREMEVVGLFAGGQSISEIARTLKRDIRTVSRQKRNAMIKFGVSNDAGLFIYVRAYGIS
ncbi:response regulator [Paraburkholderia megapolitana]|uniref:Two component transcriptional regulator, LuxR family n=1 Tax=Paraburkholderia megapolitana TaxID=420953 RepID=A0A1I3G449_9BURK|nr:response regulator [Paraburkholderia megapolitana]SFI18234.1 two component transcriptional regulator, LuxR family [Paraburkholderia megapolitana]